MRTALAPLLALLVAGVVLVVPATATANPATLLLAPRPTAPTPYVDLRLGVGGGGSAFLTPLTGPVVETTTRMTGNAFLRLRLPRMTARSAELYGVWGHGLGLTMKNNDLHLGPLWLHLLDVGLFYATAAPITVQRVERKWDATLGVSAELDLPMRLTLSADLRFFMPLDVFGVVTEHGDAARLIGEEIVKGGQLWLGISYRL